MPSSSAEVSTTTSLDEEMKKARMATAFRTILPIIGLVAIFIIFNVITNGGMVSSMSLVISQVYPIIISSMGVFFIMTMGGLDFSQGSILGLAAIVICVVSRVSLPLAIVAGIATGAGIGAINGFFYVNRKIKSFIVTICTMFLFRGLIKYLTSDSPVSGSMDLMMIDTTGLKVTLTVIILAVGFVVFRFTRFGTDLKAIGAGEKAAKFAGIRTDRMKFWVYVLSGAITGFAAFFTAIKNGSVTASGGNQLETQILIALVLGGMPISGGAKVNFLNIIVGSFMYVILQSGLNMMGISTQMNQLIQGVIFLVFVFIFADREATDVVK